MKVFKLLSISIILLISLTGCSFQYNEIIDLSEIHIQEAALSTEYISKGYDRYYSTEHAHYYFPAEANWDEKKLIQKAEIILKTAFEQYEIKTMSSDHINICFNEEAARYTGKTKASYVELDPTDATKGTLVYFISEGKLPVWLCCGLEIHCRNSYSEIFGDSDTIEIKQWAQEAYSEGLPGLGDEWIIPGLIENDLSNQVIAVAGKFVEHLENNKQLPELIQYYLSDNWEKAEELRNREWEKASGIPNKSTNPLVFHYIINQYDHSYFEEDLMFYIQGKEGTYYYSEADWWEYTKAVDYAITGESSISYTEEWFGYDYHGPLDVYYLVSENPEEKHGQFYDRQGNRIYAYVSNEKQDPIGIVHEVAHAIVRISGINTSGFETHNQTAREWFEEALCTAVSNLYNMGTDNIIAARNAYLYALRCLRAYCGDDNTLQYLLTVISKNGDANRCNCIF